MTRKVPQHKLHHVGRDFSRKRESCRDRTTKTRRPTWCALPYQRSPKRLSESPKLRSFSWSRISLIQNKAHNSMSLQGWTLDLNDHFELRICAPNLLGMCVAIIPKLKGLMLWEIVALGWGSLPSTILFKHGGNVVHERRPSHASCSGIAKAEIEGKGLRCTSSFSRRVDAHRPILRTFSFRHMEATRPSHLLLLASFLVHV